MVMVRVNGIGIWNKILKLLSDISILTNVCKQFYLLCNLKYQGKFKFYSFLGFDNRIFIRFYR